MRDGPGWARRIGYWRTAATRRAARCRNWQVAGVEVLVATGAEGQRRQHDFRPEPPHPLAKEPQADWIKSMQQKMALPEHRAHYRLRKQTVEPVFGIVKQAMGFRQFLLRGLEKVEGEWALVTLAYNCRRLHNLRLA